MSSNSNNKEGIETIPEKPSANINKILTDPDQQKLVQLERIERYRQNLTPQNQEFIRKELMLNIDVDINNFIDPNLFPNYYELKNKKNEETLSKITSYQNYIQISGLILGVAFAAKMFNPKTIWWLAGGSVIITGSKYASNKYFYQQIHENQVYDYWRKSKKLDGDLRKTDSYIKQRKFFEKYGPSSSL
eukprot:403358143